MRAAIALIALAGCGGDDPCAGIAGTCLAIHVSSTSAGEVDQLELDLLYGDRHATTTTQAAGGQVVALPLATAVELELEGSGPLAIGVVAAGKLSGVVVGTGAASAVLDPGEHASVELRLAPAEACVAGSLYCGGDKVAGDPGTLYMCNGGGVPLARGACVFGCQVTPTDDDACVGGGGVCVEGSDYCGGDKVDGDPQTLYRCSGGVGVAGVECAEGCVVRPGDDDVCR